MAAMKGRELLDRGLGHLRRFALPLGVRRALDYSWCLSDFNPGLADPKRGQVQWRSRPCVRALLQPTRGDSTTSGA